MTRERAKSLLPIITAWAEGGEIEFKSSTGWLPMTPNPIFCGLASDYRIKRKLRERWVNVYEDAERIHATRIDAEENKTRDCVETIHFREVES